jgi:DNA-binding MarR family transcriptional regulator
MLTPAFRKRLFLHQDGFILAMILDALREHKVMDQLGDGSAHAVADIARRTPATPAYLHVALRCLAQAGWLNREGAPGTDALAYRLTDAGRTVAPAFPLYADLGRFLRRHLPLDKSLLNGSGPAPRQEFAQWVDRAVADWSLSDFPGLGPRQEQVRHHLNGNLALGIMLGLWNLNYFESPWPSAGKDAAISDALRFLAHLGWYDRARDVWTLEGKIACGHALHYGMVGSYYPMLIELNSLLFGNRTIHAGNPGEEEWHVDRRLNVLASSAAHARYFRDADAIFLDIFNREPVAEQPAFIADNGCGDGSWLKHINALIVERTERGKRLRDYPLLMVAADYSAVALDVARKTLSDADVPALALSADITEPERFARDLAAHGLDIERGLHVRAFIDHNRRYQPAERGNNGGDLSTGAYVDALGQTIPNRVLEAELVSFLQRWTPYVGRHGLVLLEAHCVDPQVAARHGGEVHNIVFDTYHGFSQQYPVDFEVFMQAARTAGLAPMLHHQRRYPSRKPFVSISINHFTVPKPETPIPKGPVARTEGWRPSGAESFADGEALHRLLYEDGDLGTPRAWCANPTALLLREALAHIDARLDRIRGGGHPAISIMDYGTGTGFAVIELLKALRARGTLRKLEELKAKLTIHMLDIPSGWFAKGHALLEGCGHVEFASIRAPDGAFLPLPAVLAGKRMDLAIASMVFHLVPPAALARLFDGLADVLHEDGSLVWNAPDIGPAPPHASLFHQPNRALRRRLLEILDEPALLDGILDRLDPSERARYADLPARLGAIGGELTKEARVAAQLAADRQILPVANDAGAIADALARRFDGKMFAKSFEIRPADSLTAMLVPANQRYLPEIEDLALRRRVTTLLMTHEILPALCDGLAGTTYGFSLHWTFGRHRPKKAAN